VVVLCDREFRFPIRFAKQKVGSISPVSLVRFLRLGSEIVPNLAYNFPNKRDISIRLRLRALPSASPIEGVAGVIYALVKGQPGCGRPKVLDDG
jgi:hypothetical protein